MMSGDHRQRGLGLLGCGEADQAHDTGVRKAAHHDELAEILLGERSAPDAGVEQDSQLSLPTATGSTRSWATSRLA